MKRKLVIDLRSGTLHIDWKAASGAIASGLAFYFLAERFIPGVWFHVVVVLFIVSSIGLDVWVGRRELKAGPASDESLDAGSPPGTDTTP